VPKVLRSKQDGFPQTGTEPPAVFYLAESRVVDPREEDTRDGEFRDLLNDGETFETDFIGTTHEECQKWAMKQWNRFASIWQNVIVITDKRSADDETILLVSVFNC
jgi:hypothetical protein